MNEKGKIKFDPTDWGAMKELMAQYGDIDTAIDGTNTNGEDVLISISKNSIVVRTLQSNGWMRRDIYSLIDGDYVTETIYEGK